MFRATRLTFLITDLDRGGSPLLLSALAPGLLNYGFDVEVVSIAPEGEVAGLLRQRGVPVFSLNAQGPYDFSIIARFANHMRRSRPDLVASVLIHANLLAVLAKPFVPAGVTWVQSIHTLQERPHWHWCVQGMLSSFADSFVAPSLAVIRKLEGFGPVPHPVVIPNGIDVARFRHAQPIPLSQCPWPADAFVVGYLGRFDPVKRIPLLLEATAHLIEKIPRLHVALVGYGSQEAELRDLARRLRIEQRVHFVPVSAVPEQWYKSFDVFCSPSAAEGFGLTLAEAAAACVPVICADTPAIRETVQKAVWLPEDVTPQAIALAISGVFQRPRQILPFVLLQKCNDVREMILAYAAHFRSLLAARSQ